MSLIDPLSILWNHMSWGLQRPSTARCTQGGTEVRVASREVPTRLEYLARGVKGGPEGGGRSD